MGNVVASPRMASHWLTQLDAPDADLYLSLTDLYSVYPPIVRERIALIRRVVARFIERFGDQPIRLFRSPGRINLRGMHIDTHGGGLNLMSHQRETVLAVAEPVAVVSDAKSPQDEVLLANMDPQFEETRFTIYDASPHLDSQTPWTTFVQQADVQDALAARRGYWGHYIKGCALALRHRFPDRLFHGLRGVIGSDIPHGAALSSSAALCVAVTLALAELNEVPLSPLERILIARDAEWYTGSRCGLSDQAAMVLARSGTLVHVAIYPPSPEIDSARYVKIDEHDVAVLVVNSCTRRSISGAELARYTTNRFAYSLALEILRQEMQRCQDPRLPQNLIDHMDRLSHVSPDVFLGVGGQATLMRLVQCIPEVLTMDAIRERYHLPELDCAYQHYFGGVPEAHRPQTIGLRGPLLFGIAESERARLFPALIEERRWSEAGMLMNVGHEGDRVTGVDGTPVRVSVDDAALEPLIHGTQSLAMFPGAYGASSAALDTLVDTAREAGAWGACLTGAGIAGTVVALCPTDRVESIMNALRARLAAPDYAQRARLEQPLTKDQIAQAVMPNVSVAGACELAW